MSHGNFSEKFRPPNGTLRRGLDAFCKGHRSAGAGAQDVREVGTVHAELSGKGSHGLGEGVLMLGHDPKFIVCDTTKSRMTVIDELSSCRQHVHMEIWPQRERFKKLVNSYRRKHQIDRPTMAERLGVKESHLHGLLYDKRVRPGLEVVQRAAEIFEVSITDLVDDPGGAPPGIQMDKWVDASEMDRLLASAILEDLMKIPDEEKELYYKLWRQGIEIGIRRKETEGRNKKQG